MNYLSTRNSTSAIHFSKTILEGLAPEGGLFVPEAFPQFKWDEFDRCSNLAEFATLLLTPWLQGDSLLAELREICQGAFNFPIVLKKLDEGASILELFHGPTAAFKDVGAKFLAECFSRIQNLNPKTILVATSGDTGGAVASAFWNKPNFKVVILFPKDKISFRQQKQLTTWGGNIQALEVRGSFDDCQRIVKEAFMAEKQSNSKRTLLSANSINLGRLLPQTIYYANAALEYFRKNEREPGFIIPTGNLGNAVAALWTKKMGFPIREVVLATNSNISILEYFKTGKWKAFPTVETLANAMDVGNPSNMERLIHLYPSVSALKQEVKVVSVNDFQISKTIQESNKVWNQIFCPHTATAVYARETLGGKDWIIVATAHPAKFDSMIEPLVGQSIPVPEGLAQLLRRPSQVEQIKPTLTELAFRVPL